MFNSGDGEVLCHAVPPEPERDGGSRAGTSEGAAQHGCKHYRRRAKLVAPCCDAVYWCRHCHNEARDGPESQERDPQRWHQLDRSSVQEVVCALCSERQPVAAACRACGVAFGEYTCTTCRFFDDEATKGQFHCDKCGICRVGGRENFFHCDTCGCCYSLTLQENHVCVERSTHQLCPVCQEYLFDSVKPVSVMRCGHTIHEQCFGDMCMHFNYVCPICSKSVQDMSQMWQVLEQEVRDTPMPEEYRDVRVTILCNDCGRTSETPFHVVGLRCQYCNTYNTRRT